jgi:hypothetical protein
VGKWLAPQDTGVRMTWYFQTPRRCFRHHTGRFPGCLTLAAAKPIFRRPPGLPIRRRHQHCCSSLGHFLAKNLLARVAAQSLCLHSGADNGDPLMGSG